MQRRFFWSLFLTWAFGMVAGMAVLVLSAPVPEPAFYRLPDRATRAALAEQQRRAAPIDRAGIASTLPSVSTELSWTNVASPVVLQQRLGNDAWMDLGHVTGTGQFKVSLRLALPQ